MIPAISKFIKKRAVAVFHFALTAEVKSSLSASSPLTTSFIILKVPINSAPAVIIGIEPKKPSALKITTVPSCCHNKETHSGMSLWSCG